MTTYPGDDPQTPDEPQDPASRAPEGDVPAPQVPDGTEPTQPVGYWVMTRIVPTRRRPPTATP